MRVWKKRLWFARPCGARAAPPRLRCQPVHLAMAERALSFGCAGRSARPCAARSKVQEIMWRDISRTASAAAAHRHSGAGELGERAAESRRRAGAAVQHVRREARRPVVAGRAAVLAAGGRGAVLDGHPYGPAQGAGLHAARKGKGRVRGASSAGGAGCLCAWFAGALLDMECRGGVRPRPLRGVFPETLDARRACAPPPAAHARAPGADARRHAGRRTSCA